jgi:hypothetical protein
LQGPLQAFLKLKSWRHEVAPCSCIVAGFGIAARGLLEKIMRATPASADALY